MFRFPTSAKTGEGISEAMESVVPHLLNSAVGTKNSSVRTEPETIKISNHKTKKSNCCS